MDNIAKLDSQVVRALLVAIAGLAGIIASYFGISEEVFNEQAVRIIDAACLIMTTGGAAWAMWARLYLPTPPLTDAAAAKTEDRIRQGGFARPLMLAALLAVAAPVAIMLPGCAGTQTAYRAAETPDEYAFVLAEHYAALVRQAADLRERSTTPPAAIEAMRRAELAARPLIAPLRPLRDAYLAARSAETELELQRAIDAAVLAIADLVRQVQAAQPRVTTRLERQTLTLKRSAA